MELTNNAIIVEVTEQDIKDGARGDCYYCPIALAVQRALNHPPKVHVIISYVHVVMEDLSMKTYSLPQVATDFIVDFDHDFKISPFTFEMLPYVPFVEPQ